MPIYFLVIFLRRDACTDTPTFSRMLECFHAYLGVGVDAAEGDKMFFPERNSPIH